jgi:hypothetical protein
MNLQFVDGPQLSVSVRSDGLFSVGDVPTGTAKVTFHGLGSTSNLSPENQARMTDEQKRMMEESLKAGDGRQAKGMEAGKKIPTRYTSVESTPETWLITTGTNTRNFDLTE